MPALRHAKNRSTRRALGRALTTAAALGACSVLLGCEVDSFLAAPNIAGRWEHTPTVVPILERIDVIEADTGEFVDVTSVTPDDLVVEANEYQLSPGDFVEITIYELFSGGAPYISQVAINESGMVEIPDIGRVRLAGRTTFQAREAIAQALVEANRFNSIEDAIVDLRALSRQEASYSVFGAVQAPARYPIPRPDHRLLEALTNAGGVSPIIREVYVIRQVPLSDAVDGGTPLPDEPAGPDRVRTPDQTRPANDGGTTSVEDLLEELEREGDEPGLIGPGVLDDSAHRPQPRGRGVAPGAFQDGAAGLEDGDDPAIDLDDSSDTGRAGVPAGPAGVGAAPVNPQDALSQGEWRFINGRWIRVLPADPQSMDQLPEGNDPLDDAITADDLVTQRVIGIPTGPLLQGVARYNIVIRPGDIIHVPTPETGLVYATGPGIARPGSYNIPANGRLTMQRLIATAGGFSQIAVPERVDLTRMVGDDRQATIRLNVRAIIEGTHPDVFMRPDDLVNFGTNFLATPWAVIRNGFRTSYGFGFLLDRNFGADVFGAPPSNNQFGQN